MSLRHYIFAQDVNIQAETSTGEIYSKIKAMEDILVRMDQWHGKIFVERPSNIDYNRMMTQAFEIQGRARTYIYNARQILKMRGENV